MKLNLGCGKDVLEGWINCDIIKTKGVNKVFDLNKFPYPFKTNSVDEVRMFHILEHLDDPDKVIRELWRICKGGAKVEIRVPHFSSPLAWGDLTHRRPFSCWSLNHYDYNLLNNPNNRMNKTLHNYKEKIFFKVKKRLVFGRLHRLLGIEWFANNYTDLYEAFFAWIFPARELRFYLEVVK
ncbi:MAG: hypothetical protein KatS3mg093_337 [Candidatus Parcubacteria bacterium]|nr:MAG: hypothetical protein KatS3mg001_300 [Candidatus Pacearchaeota archaeon]GIW65358.1 MAG: hypothetical protein KatS3mg093_337 [Candidatus Parcubacteria bacterium]